MDTQGLHVPQLDYQDPAGSSETVLDWLVLHSRRNVEDIFKYIDQIQEATTYSRTFEICAQIIIETINLTNTSNYWKPVGMSL